MDQNIKTPWSDWKIVELLGRGSYGSVYKTEKISTPGFYEALKIIEYPVSPAQEEELRKKYGDEQSYTAHIEQSVQRMKNEFTVMNKMQGHSNIVSYIDHEVAKREEFEGYVVYIRMELLTPLSTVILKRALSAEEIVKLGVDICSALEVCKFYDVIHRDIKPTNIFISKLGEFKLGDFGIARNQNELNDGTMTIIGTRGYIAPEVLTGEKYNSTVDIYSLGKVLEALLLQRRDHNAARYRCLWDVINIACKHNPLERFQTAEEMKSALKKCKLLMAENNDVLPIIESPDTVLISKKQQQSEFDVETLVDSEKRFPSGYEEIFKERVLFGDNKGKPVSDNKFSHEANNQPLNAENHRRDQKQNYSNEGLTAEVGTVADKSGKNEDAYVRKQRKNLFAKIALGAAVGIIAAVIFLGCNHFADIKTEQEVLTKANKNTVSNESSEQTTEPAEELTAELTTEPETTQQMSAEEILSEQAGQEDTSCMVNYEPETQPEPSEIVIEETDASVETEQEIVYVGDEGYLLFEDTQYLIECPYPHDFIVNNDAEGALFSAINPDDTERIEVFGKKLEQRQTGGSVIQALISAHPDYEVNYSAYGEKWAAISMNYDSIDRYLKILLREDNTVMVWFEYCSFEGLDNVPARIEYIEEKFTSLLS